MLQDSLVLNVIQVQKNDSFSFYGRGVRADRTHFCHNWKVIGSRIQKQPTLDIILSPDYITLKKNFKNRLGKLYSSLLLENARSELKVNHGLYETKKMGVSWLTGMRNFMKNMKELRNFVSLSETVNWAFLIQKNGIYKINGRSFGIYMKIVKISGIFKKTLHFKEIFCVRILLFICHIWCDGNRGKI